MQDGKTDYKSVTVAEDATAQEFMDFYLDDDIRAKWVSPPTAVGALAKGTWGHDLQQCLHPASGMLCAACTNTSLRLGVGLLTLCRICV